MLCVVGYLIRDGCNCRRLKEAAFHIMLGQKRLHFAKQIGVACASGFEKLRALFRSAFQRLFE
ncbi:MAG: hypothetical protein AUI33_04670 [Ignavibacteria bacterium 13_1_40CM_2_61_4]|nr:MAG: hypothetical protein AUI33_04670 [Ignavibacteria bacterium 13_1_40CM_2_61_4]